MTHGLQDGRLCLISYKIKINLVISFFFKSKKKSSIPGLLTQTAEDVWYSVVWPAAFIGGTESTAIRDSPRYGSQRVVVQNNVAFKQIFKITVEIIVNNSRIWLSRSGNVFIVVSE